MLGYTKESPHWILLNHILIIGKQIIYSSRLSKSKPLLSYSSSNWNIWNGLNIIFFQIECYLIWSEESAKISNISKLWIFVCNGVQQSVNSSCSKNVNLYFGPLMDFIINHLVVKFLRRQSYNRTLYLLMHKTQITILFLKTLTV